MTSEPDQEFDNLNGTEGLIPKAQINEVLRNLNIREGLFSDEDIDKIENGYSISDTGDALGGFDADLISLGSGQIGGLLASPDVDPGFYPERHQAHLNLYDEQVSNKLRS